MSAAVVAIRRQPPFSVARWAYVQLPDAMAMTGGWCSFAGCLDAPDLLAAGGCANLGGWGMPGECSGLLVERGQ